MGISYNQANSLINEGRRRRDGGSTTLEKNMNKMKGYKDGGSNKVKAPPRKPFKEVIDGIPFDGTEGEFREGVTRGFTEEQRRQIEEDTRDFRSKPKKGEVKAKDGKYMCRGAGKAIQGTKFTGTK
jgi:hypothetical protein